MTFSVRDAFLTNWPIKLTSLALAAVLWAAVAAEEPTTLLVPVTLLVEPPKGRALTRPLPPVRALYAGPARELIKLYAAPPYVTLAVPDTVSGATYLLDLSPSDLKLHGRAEVRAQDIQPRRVEVALDAVSRRTVPVASGVTIGPEAGFAERVLLSVPVQVRGEHGGSGWIIDPPTVMVTVRGPASRVAQLGRDSLAVVVFPTAGGRRETARASVVVPAGIEASATPDTIHVQRRGDG